MNYHILSSNTGVINGSESKGAVFFTTDRTIGRDAEAIFHYLGMPDMDAEKAFARPHQTHTDRVLHVKQSFFSLSQSERATMMEGIDAVVSDVEHVCLGVSTADCIPVLVYDPEHHAAAAIHAGWRGTAKRIVENAMREMQHVFGTQPSLCSAVVGPGISQQSFEVGWEVHQQFVDAGFSMADVTVALPDRNAAPADLQPPLKPHIDLKEINRRQLMAMGVLPENITVSDIDTFTDERFFSARREQVGNTKCGRIFSGFVLSKCTKLF